MRLHVACWQADIVVAVCDSIEGVALHGFSDGRSQRNATWEGRRCSSAPHQYGQKTTGTVQLDHRGDSTSGCSASGAIAAARNLGCD